MILKRWGVLSPPFLLYIIYTIIKKGMIFMLKTKIFSGENNTYQWNGRLSMSVDDQFNKWMNDNPGIDIKTIEHSHSGSTHSIFIMYEIDDTYKEKVYIEEGKYLLDLLNFKIISVKGNIDVTYMFSNIGIMINEVLRRTNTEDTKTCYVDFKDEIFSLEIQYSDKVNINHKLLYGYSDDELHYNERTKNSGSFVIQIKASEVLRDEYIPLYKPGNKIFSFNKDYIGTFLFGINSDILVFKENKIDLSFAVRDFEEIRRTFSNCYLRDKYEKNEVVFQEIELKEDGNF